MRWWPRSIRWQMIFGLALLEVLSVGLFALLLVNLQQRDIHRRAEHRLAHQADSVVEQAEEALRKQSPDWIALSAHMMSQAPSVSRVRVTDPAGNTLYESSDDQRARSLDAAELAQIPLVRNSTKARVITVDKDRWESVKPIYSGANLYGYAWIESDRHWDTEELDGVLRGTGIFALIWIGASALLVLLITRGISLPLALLHKGTRELASSPESSGSFPLPITTSNEIGDLIAAFNRMVAAVDEQRSGLRDTLSLLDSMLAYAPVGFAFYDRHARTVRVNQIFADLTGIPISRQLGRTPEELFPTEVAGQFHEALQKVFITEEPVSDLEFHGVTVPGPWTWLVSAYPVSTSPSQVRWAGVIIRDVSERVRSEEALRKTEKLAATGRLAASIAHEINNPLEGLTNLLYLLRTFSGLSGPALDYVHMAEHQTRRIAEIAQKTLRFYRQSTLPVRARVGELVDSILDLYKTRMHTLNIALESEMDPEATLFCYEGEIRQVLANLVGNAIDATASGGRLIVRARRSRCWTNGEAEGVRLTVADTGSGMSPDVRSRIFEAFFTTKEAIGTGLGLWVSQEIIEKHRGLVSVRSRAAGNGGPSGTVFHLFLPDDETLASRQRSAG
ncbi:sensor histidine kinase [Occallatibacter riparius]|uniref:histidine kinase n=1 Tax=Occallatibacter riparius TaxID=1002689 RepID=A0A9J7BVH4_9BACT|nr:ATP-binding protein [Occallatibacter riparius]UWZ86875.1 ATP-binding protein [Occallatibacter riparius]